MAEMNSTLRTHELEEEEFDLDYNVDGDENGDGGAFSVDYTPDEDDLDLDIADANADNASGVVATPSFSPTKPGENTAFKLKDFTRIAVSMDSHMGFKPQSPECVTLSEIEFDTEAEVEYANRLREQMMAGPIEPTSEYYKALFLEREAVKVNQLYSHIKYASDVYERFTSMLVTNVERARAVEQSLSNTLKRPLEEFKTPDNSSNKFAELKYAEMKLNHESIAKNYYSALRRYETYNLKVNRITDFLNAYYKAYSEFGTLYAESKYLKSALAVQGELDGSNYMNCKCSACKGENMIHANKLPHIEIGKMTYNVNILENLKTMFEFYSKIEEDYRDSSIKILMSGAEAGGFTDLIAKANATSDKLEKIKILHVVEVFNAIPNREEANYYNSAIYPHLRSCASSDLRLRLLPVFKQFCIDDIKLYPNASFDEAQASKAKHLYPDISTPTERNVLEKRHPLLMKSVIDPINANSKKNTIVPVWKEILYTGINMKEPQGASQAQLIAHRKANAERKYSNELRFIELVAHNLDKMFMYPNPALLGTNTPVPFKQEKMEGWISVPPKSPLRFVTPDVVCQECGKPLLIHSTVMYASRSYMEHLRGSKTSIDIMDTATVNLIGIMGPVLKARVRKQNLPTKVERAYDPFKKINAENEKGRTSVQTANVKSVDYSDGFSRDNTVRMNVVKNRFKFVTDKLASEYCQAEDRNDTIKMQELIAENERRRAGKSAQAESVITTAKIEEAMEAYGIPTQELAVQFLMAEKDGNEAEQVRILQLVQEQQDEALDSAEDNIMETLMAEYGGKDIMTMSYDELTSKGLYKYENLLNVYKLSETQYDCVEAILVAIMSDDASIATLPPALQDSIHEYYEFREGGPTELYSSMGLMI